MVLIMATAEAQIQHSNMFTGRSTIIGSSEAAKALGLSRWESPAELVMRKQGLIEDTRTPERALAEDATRETLMAAGLALEPVVIKHLEEHHWGGRKVRYIHTGEEQTRGQLLDEKGEVIVEAHPDGHRITRIQPMRPGRSAQTGVNLLEVKTTNAYVNPGMKDGDVSTDYFVQVQLAMHALNERGVLSNCNATELAVMDRTSCEIYTQFIVYDKDLAEKWTLQLEEFRDQYLRVSPEVAESRLMDLSLDGENIFATLQPQPDADKKIYVNTSDEELEDVRDANIIMSSLYEIEEAEGVIKEQQNIIENNRERIIAVDPNAEELLVNGVKVVSHKTSKGSISGTKQINDLRKHLFDDPNQQNAMGQAFRNQAKKMLKPNASLNDITNAVTRVFGDAFDRIWDERRPAHKTKDSRRFNISRSNFEKLKDDNPRNLVEQRIAKLDSKASVEQTL